MTKPQTVEQCLDDLDNEAWRPALVAFCERDGMPQRAEGLRHGDAFDPYDERLIAALREALVLAPKVSA